MLVNAEQAAKHVQNEEWWPEQEQGHPAETQKTAEAGPEDEEPADEESVPGTGQDELASNGRWKP